MTAILDPHAKRNITTFEQLLNEKKLLIELDRIMHCDSFDDDRMHGEIMQPMPDLEGFEERKQKGLSLKEKNMPAEVASLYSNPVLTREQEYHQFRKFNFLKYEAKQLLLRKNHGVSVQMRVTKMLEEVVELKKFLAACNMRLAMSLAKKRAYYSDQGSNGLWLLLSEANMGIMRAIPCFDFNRKVKFGTYATWAIKNNIGRSDFDERQHQDRFFATDDIKVFDRPIEEKDSTAEADRQQFVAEFVEALLKKIDRRDGEIIRMYLLDRNEPTLDVVGQHFGITKERVRQIKVRSIRRLKEVAARGGPSLNGFLKEFADGR